MMRPSHRKRPGGPRSRAFRERRDGGDKLRPYEVWEALYALPGARVRPWWARLAFDRGWMTLARYIDTPATEPSAWSMYVERVGKMFAATAKELQVRDAATRAGVKP